MNGNGRGALETWDQDRRDAETARLKKEVQALRERERLARAEAADARAQLSHLTAMSKRFASSMNVGARERQQHRHRLAAQYGVSRVLAEARDLQEAAPKVFEILGERLGWQLGVLWTVDRRAGVLRRRGIWRSSGSSPGAMEEACEDMVLRRGESLPGRVWEREEPAWVEDVLEDRDFLRNEAAAEDGLRGAFAFPLKEGGFVGVFEFFRREVLPPDENLLRTGGIIGDQIGQFLERRKAEEERDHALVKEREARQRATGILESINDCFYALDGEFRFTYVNAQTEEYFGIPRERMLGRIYMEVLPETGGHEILLRQQEAMAEQKTVRFETQSPVTGRWVDLGVFPAGGGLTVYFRDVTERKQTQEALRESQERLRLALDAVEMGTFRYHVAEDRGEPDARMLALFGLPAGSTLNLAEAVERLIHPDDTAAYAEAVERATDPNGDGTLREELRVFHPDGSLRWVALTAQTIFEGDPPRAALMYGVAADITERKRAEYALRKSEERFRLFVTAASETVYIMSADWSEMRALEGKSFLADTRNSSPTWLEEYIPDSDKALVQAALAEAVRAKTMLELEHRVIRADGTVGWTFSRAIPFLDERGEIVEWFGAASDITERKRAEERQAFLLKLNDAVRPLASTEEVTATACRLLVEHLDGSRAQHTEVKGEPGEKIGVVRGEFVRTGEPMTRRFPLGAFSEPLIAVLRGGETLVLTNTDTDARLNEAQRAAFRSVDSPAAISAPLVKENRLAAVFTIHNFTPRDWTEAEIELVSEVAERTWATVERARAEKALRESEARFRRVFSNNMEAMAIWTPPGGITAANDAMLDLIGYTREELEAGSLDWIELTPPEYRDRDESAIAEVMANGACEPYEKEFVHKDGRRVPILIGGGRFDERVGTGILFAVDLTECNRAEEALRKSEERYKALYEDNPFMYFTIDARGAVLSVNSSGAQQLGYTVEELVGHPLLDLFHEEDREDVSRYLDVCLQDLERPSSWEARKMRKDGSIIWVTEHLRIVKNPDGNKIGLLLCEDITERKQAEEQVLLQAQLLEQVQAAVISTDLQGMVTYWNEHAEELYGWSREEALGHNNMRLTVDPEEAEVAGEIMERLQAGETWAGEFAARRKDGSKFPAHVTDSLIYDAQGRAIGIVGVSTDITERKKAEEERGRLLAHEWRVHAEAEERKRISRELHDRVAHAMGVVHQSLELYEALKERNVEQAEARMQLARETTREALDLTRNLSRELHDTEAKDGLSAALSNLLKTAVPPGIEGSISVEGDEQLIPPHIREQLFLILREAVRNAVSHAGAKHLKLKVEARPEMVVGGVEDDGRGFEETTEGSLGRGIDSMRERAELVDGTFRLSSFPEAGTKIEASIPLKEDRSGREQAMTGVADE